MRREGTLANIYMHFNWAITDGNLTKKQAERLEIMIAEFFAEHWRDDDSPQSEMTLGVRRKEKAA